MKLQFEIERFDLKARNNNAILRRLNYETMERHRTDRLPLRFTSTGYTLLGFAPRTTAYNKRKQKKRGHTQPNVYSGALQRAVFRHVRITATPSRGDLKTRGSRRHRMWSQNKREIESVAQSEVDLETKRQASKYRNLAVSPQYARKRKRKIG